MTARPQRRRRMPNRKDMQRALKRGMAALGERIAARVFFLFSLLVIATGISMWKGAPETHMVAGMFIAIGVTTAIVSLNWGK
jgi:hypothetical protein